MMRGESELTPEEKLDIAGTTWINAFALIGEPSEELIRDVGMMVIDKLKHSEVQLDTLGVRHGKVTWIRVVAS